MIWLIILTLLNFVYYYLAKFRILKLSSIANIKPLCNIRYYGFFSLAIFDILYIVYIALSKYIFNPHISLNIIAFIIINLTVLFIIFRFNINFNAREKYELILKNIFLMVSLIAILITSIIILMLLFEALKFFKLIPFGNFLLGLKWAPQTEILEELKYSFGIIPILIGTLIIVFIAMVIAMPIGLFSAIYLSEYASLKAKFIIKPIIELLSGVPTIVYGYFAAIVVGPEMRNLFEYFNIHISTESALNAGIVMGIMITPFVMSLNYEVFNSISQTYREASLALGSTKSETITKILLPSAFPSLVSIFLLAVSRAIGETMIVTMASGLNANLTFNPLDSVTTITAQIVSLLTGDQEFNSPKTLAAFGLAFILFIITLMLNLISILITKKYRSSYE